MALINCPECGKEVSEQAKICIHCGYPFNKNKINSTSKKSELHYAYCPRCLANGVIDVADYDNDIICQNCCDTTNPSYKSSQHYMITELRYKKDEDRFIKLLEALTNEKEYLSSESYSFRTKKKNLNFRANLYEQKKYEMPFDIIEIKSSDKQYNEYLLTTGYDFEGYKIEKYIRVVSGTIVLGTGFLSEFSASVSDLLGTTSEVFAEKLEIAKDAAVKQLIDKSVNLGGNAVIGVDFDYIIFSNNMIGVVANGTSVLVEAVED